MLTLPCFAGSPPSKNIEPSSPKTLIESYPTTGCLIPSLGVSKKPYHVVAAPLHAPAHPSLCRRCRIGRRISLIPTARQGCSYRTGLLLWRNVTRMGMSKSAHSARSPRRMTDSRRCDSLYKKLSDPSKHAFRSYSRTPKIVVKAWRQWERPRAHQLPPHPTSNPHLPRRRSSFIAQDHLNPRRSAFPPVSRLNAPSLARSVGTSLVYPSPTKKTTPTIPSPSCPPSPTDTAAPSRWRNNSKQR